MKFIQSYGKFNLNESKIEIDMQAEFQSVIDILDGVKYDLDNHSIEIFLGDEDIITDNIEHLRKVIQEKKKYAEILEDCLHVVERLKDDGINITMSFVDSVVKIKIMDNKEIGVENIFDIEYEPGVESKHRVILNKINLFTYFKNKCGINIIKVIDGDDYSVDEEIHTYIASSYTGDLDPNKFKDFILEMCEIKTTDAFGNEETFENYIMKYSIEDQLPRNKYFTFTLDADVMIV